MFYNELGLDLGYLQAFLINHRKPGNSCVFVSKLGLKRNRGDQLLSLQQSRDGIVLLGSLSVAVMVMSSILSPVYLWLWSSNLNRCLFSYAFLPFAFTLYIRYGCQRDAVS